MKWAMRSERQENFMMNSKKVILFLVEGFSDKMALEHIMEVLTGEQKVIFTVMNGDITSNRTTRIENVVRKVGEEVKACITRYKLHKMDIMQIIHIVDADGAFIPQRYIRQGEEPGFYYTDKGIIVKNKKAAEERNKKKSEILEKLIATGKIYGLPYSIFYMSCNLDHVLYNIQNLTKDQKVEYADAFYEKYLGHEERFRTFIEDDGIAPQGAYKETWEFLQSDLNSLKRYSNLHLFLNILVKNV